MLTMRASCDGDPSRCLRALGVTVFDKTKETMNLTILHAPRNIEGITRKRAAILSKCSI